MMDMIELLILGGFSVGFLLGTAIGLLAFMPQPYRFGFDVRRPDDEARTTSPLLGS